MKFLLNPVRLLHPVRLIDTTEYFAVVAAVGSTASGSGAFSYVAIGAAL
jgi:hypothetical protein